MKLFTIVFCLATLLCAQDKAARPCPADDAPSKEWQGSALHKAIQGNDSQRAEKLIEAGAAVDERDSIGNTPLVTALTIREALEPAGIVERPEQEALIRIERRAQIAIVNALLRRKAM